MFITLEVGSRTRGHKVYMFITLEVGSRTRGHKVYMFITLEVGSRTRGHKVLVKEQCIETVIRKKSNKLYNTRAIEIL